MTDNEAVPMCPDMTCSHKDSKCKAFAADKMDYDPYDLNGVSVNCLGNMVWYKDNHIYMIKGTSLAIILWNMMKSLIMKVR